MNITDREQAELNTAEKQVSGCLNFIICAIIAYIVGTWTGVYYERHKDVPKERNEIIDSLTTVNDSIKIKIEKLDSIKDAKVIEVTTLDNDSTLKLFYELVSE